MHADFDIERAEHEGQILFIARWTRAGRNHELRTKPMPDTADNSYSLRMHLINECYDEMLLLAKCEDD